MRAEAAGAGLDRRDGPVDVDGRRAERGDRGVEPSTRLRDPLARELAPPRVDVRRCGAGEDQLEHRRGQVTDPAPQLDEAGVVGREVGQPREADVAGAPGPELDRHAERGQWQERVEPARDRAVQVALIARQRTVGGAEALRQPHRLVSVGLVAVGPDVRRVLAGDVRRQVDHADRSPAPVRLGAPWEQRIDAGGEAAREERVDPGAQQQEHRRPVAAADRAVVAQVGECLV